MNRDYLVEAFGSFDPRHDADAAMKFCLNAVLMDHRIEDLARLLERQLQGLAGDPGWEFGWTDDERSQSIHALVDERGYSLTHPHITVGKDTFYDYVASAMRAYAQRNVATSEAERVLAIVKARST